jgi:hypothetical protein
MSLHARYDNEQLAMAMLCAGATIVCAEQRSVTNVLSQRTWMSHLMWSGGRCGTTLPLSALGSRPAAQSHALHGLHSILHVHRHRPRVLLVHHTQHLCRRCHHLQAQGHLGQRGVLGACRPLQCLLLTAAKLQESQMTFSADLSIFN